jgi:hypothetical protein
MEAGSVEISTGEKSDNLQKLKRFCQMKRKWVEEGVKLNCVLLYQTKRSAVERLIRFSGGLFI